LSAGDYETTLKLHRIQAHTIAGNHRSVRLLERLGFRLEGTLREYSMKDDLSAVGHCATYVSGGALAPLNR
jgi:RimJ/RimL family protein N-acetyltransferase